MDTQWLIDTMEKWSPQKWAMDGDNVGLHIGDRTRKISRVLTALDLTEPVLREAVQERFDFIITHHPLISRHVPPVNSITTDNPLGKKIMTLIANGIGHFCAHTNLDVAAKGVNDLLFDLLLLQNKIPLVPPTEQNYPTLGLVGDFTMGGDNANWVDSINWLDPTNAVYPASEVDQTSGITLATFAEHVSKALKVPNIRYVGNQDKPIQKVAICGGSGANAKMLQAAISHKCDVYVTGDIGHHFALDALENGIALIDGTHHATEVQISAAIANHINETAKQQSVEIFAKAAQAQTAVFSVLQ
ncbi:MAG: Nif3-like dinuclear metal center hexameric protein [Firmicutes bacterium]|nr:Nif3-like dinuclear metal center hexameric protein [Bacillota bacterium]